MSEVPKSFVCEFAGPPRKRFWLSHTGIEGVADQRRKGWEIVIEDLNADGVVVNVSDTWEEEFADVFRYFVLSMSWLDVETKQAVDLAKYGYEDVSQ